MVVFDHYLAEEEGFEPPEVLPSTVFKTAAIDHSAIPPVWIGAFFGPNPGIKPARLYWPGALPKRVQI